MSGIVFEPQTPVVASHPNRTDIACFAGFVRRRAQTGVPVEAATSLATVERWLEEYRWTGTGGRTTFAELLDVPVPVDSWEVFDRLFAWEQRAADDPEQGSTYLGAAVRSFFAQGGRKCYVVRMGDPWSIQDSRSERLKHVRTLVPGFPDLFDATPLDRRTWHGIAHVFGLPDVSFVCVPDLADAVGVDPATVEITRVLPEPVEQFVECSEPGATIPADVAKPPVQAPRADEDSYENWARAVRLAGIMISRYVRDVQFIASVPIPVTGSAAEADLNKFLNAAGTGPLANSLDAATNGIASAFVQLAYPWARTPGSARLPEQLESPDGVLAGLLARSALQSGAWQSAAGLDLADVYDVFPRPWHRELLAQRISLFGPTPDGLQSLSDVTTATLKNYRPACVNRLVSVIVRAARRIGEEVAFESSGPVVWGKLRGRMGVLLSSLYQLGALRGATAAEAFAVRCDPSTMTQNDIDAGRAIARVEFQASAPVERISVVLALTDGGQVSLSGTAREEAA